VARAEFAAPHVTKCSPAEHTDRPDCLNGASVLLGCALGLGAPGSAAGGSVIRSRARAAYRPGLPVPGAAASREFYAEVLGLEVAMDQGWIVTFAAPDNPAAQLSVMRADASAPVQPDVSIEVDDVDGAYSAVRRLGYEIAHPLTDEPWGVRRFWYATPAAASSTSSLTPGRGRGTRTITPSLSIAATSALARSGSPDASIPTKFPSESCAVWPSSRKPARRPRIAHEPQPRKAAGLRERPSDDHVVALRARATSARCLARRPAPPPSTDRASWR
jgi:catechol 2,3-dioxygenase-like lactoylglutathione lyase family enzyme